MIDAPALPAATNAACPWCGGSMHIIPTPPDYPSLRLLYRPQCARCGASLGGFSTEHHARCAWNLRADTPDLAALREERDRLRETLKKAEEGLDTALGMVERSNFIPSWDFLRECRTAVRAALKEPPNA